MALPEDDPLAHRLPIKDGEEIAAHSGGQEWIVSWHPPRHPPDGTPHGAAGVCITSDNQLVLISNDQQHWGFPGGRPEGDEPPEETLRREILEEACAVAVGAPQLLGFIRSQCVRGWQQGLVLVRSCWRAEVEVGPWEPRFEIRYRRLLPLAEAAEHLREPDPAANRISFRALHEAGVVAAGAARPAGTRGCSCRPRLAQARQALGASAAHLVRCFTRTFGIGPHQHVVARRVDAARRRYVRSATDEPAADSAADDGAASSHSS